MEALISVVVPVYNVKDYVEKCLSCILNQTYSNLEILIFDDGSTDGSLEICRHIAEKNKRVHLKELKHKGVSYVRNLGVAEARGDYLVFIDSDDFVDLNYVEELYRAAVTTGASIAVCSCCRIKVDEKPPKRKAFPIIEILNREQAMKELVKDQKILSTVCMKIFEREVYKQLQFPEGRVYEDLSVMYSIIDQADKITYTEYTRYYYVFRRDSICNNVYNENSMDLFIASKQFLRFIKKKYPELMQMQYLKCIRNAVSILYRMMLSGRCDKKVKQILLKEIRKGKSLFLKISYPRRDKFFVLAACYCYPLMSIALHTVRLREDEEAK